MNSRPPISISPDITRASTLPGFVYRDPCVFAAQKEKVFAPSWQFLGRVDDFVKVPGQVHPFTLLEGMLDEPLLLTRDFDDRVHLLSNVCTHRSNIVCEGPGNERHLRCRYHGRRFHLNGRFHSMPEFEQTRDFPTERDNLAHVPMAQWGPFLFASCNGFPPPFEGGGQGVGERLSESQGPTHPPAPSLGGRGSQAPALHELIAPMIERMAFLPLDDFRFDPSRSRDYLVNANWALYCDNYLEGFHIPYVHAGLNEAIDYGSYRTELFEWCNLQLGIAREGSGEAIFDLPQGGGSPDHGQRIAAYYWWVWPNTMFNFYPWGLSVNVVRPLAVDRTRVSFLAYVWDESKLDKGAGAGLDRVEREDEAIVEAVQRGVKSRFYESGRYSPTREQGVHHFHRLMAAVLNR